MSIEQDFEETWQRVSKEQSLGTNEKALCLSWFTMGALSRDAHRAPQAKLCPSCDGEIISGHGLDVFCRNCGIFIPEPITNESGGMK